MNIMHFIWKKYPKPAIDSALVKMDIDIFVHKCLIPLVFRSYNRTERYDAYDAIRIYDAINWTMF